MHVKALNPTSPTAFVDSFIVVTHLDHLMSLRINIWGCSVKMNEKSRGIQMMSGCIAVSMFDPFLVHTLPSQSAGICIHTVYFCILCQGLCVWDPMGWSVYLCTCVVALQGARLFSSAKFSSTVWGFHLRRTDTGRNCILSMSSSHSLSLSATGTPLITET